MTESILAEADRLVSTDRQSDYGPPHEDFAKTALMIQGVLLPKLREGATITAADVGLIMCCVKLSREVNKHKRDNLVDLAGYAKCIDLIEQRNHPPAATVDVVEKLCATCRHYLSINETRCRLCRQANFRTEWEPIK